MRPHLILFAAPLLLAAQAPAQREGLSYGTVLFGEPAVSDIVRPTSVDVRPGAVIAEQRVEIMGATRVLDSAVTVGAPFDQRLAAGTTFRHYRTAAGERWCKSGIPGVPYTPAHDESGAIYPGICLVDAEGDGVYEAVNMLPYEATRRPRTIPIPPVRLRAAPPVTDPRIARLLVFQRVRIVSASEREVVLIRDFGAANQLRPEPVFDPASEARETLPLRQDAVATIGGLMVRVAGQPGAWRIEATGAFAPWAALERGGAAVRAAGYYVPERED